MQWLRRAGIGVLVTSWYPADKSDPQLKDTPGFTDGALPLLLRMAEKYQLKVAIHHEPYPGRDAASIRRDIEYLIDTYGENPVWVHVSMRMTLTGPVSI